MAASVSRDTEQQFRSITSGDVDFLEGLLNARLELQDASGLDPRAFSVAKIAALIALDAPPASYLTQVTLALAEGLTPEEVMGVLIAVAPQVGLPKVLAAAPEISLALGINIEEGLA